MAVPPSCKSSLGMQSWLLKALVSMASEISLHARSPGSLAMLCRASFKMDTLISTSLDQFVQCQIHCCHVTELIYRVDASPRPIGKVDWRNKLIALKKSAHCCWPKPYPQWVMKDWIINKAHPCKGLVTFSHLRKPDGKKPRTIQGQGNIPTRKHKYQFSINLIDNNNKK